MINFSAYLYDRDLDYSDTKEEFSVHSCGYYKLANREDFHTQRPAGRRDYQILYIASGTAHFIIEGTEHILKEGSLILYKPHENQEYHYYQDERPEVYWMHFYGQNIASWLEEKKLCRPVMHVRLQTEYLELFDSIIRELMLKQEGYMELATLKGKALLVLLSRGLKSRGPEVYIRNEKIEEMIERINKEYQNEMCIDSMAKECGLSTCWFIKNFKEYTGFTPAQYVTKVRLSRARELLRSNVYNVSEIAALCGYDNPLYFSRLFKLHFGVSPKNYRNKERAAIV